MISIVVGALLAVLIAVFVGCLVLKLVVQFSDVIFAGLIAVISIEDGARPIAALLAVPIAVFDGRSVLNFVTQFSVVIFAGLIVVISISTVDGVLIVLLAVFDGCSVLKFVMMALAGSLPCSVLKFAMQFREVILAGPNVVISSVDGGWPIVASFVDGILALAGSLLCSVSKFVTQFSEVVGRMDSRLWLHDSLLSLTLDVGLRLVCRCRSAPLNPRIGLHAPSSVILPRCL